MSENDEAYIVYIGGDDGPRFQVFADSAHAACVSVREDLRRMAHLLKVGYCYARHMGDECARCKGTGSIAFPGMGDGICPTCEGRGRY